jgi:hypothetical protein
MCRYAGKTYKWHFVCFDCRKQFKRPPLVDVLAQKGTLGTYQRLLQAHRNPTQRARAERASGTTLESMEQSYRDFVSKCPQCRGEMADLGKDFKPPRMSAVHAWERLHAMYRIGRVWHTCGCDGPGYIPTSKTDYLAYLRDHIAAFSENMKEAEVVPGLDPAYRRERVQHWTSLVRKVKAELEVTGSRVGRRRASAA